MRQDTRKSLNNMQDESLDRFRRKHVQTKIMSSKNVTKFDDTNK